MSSRHFFKTFWRQIKCLLKISVSNKSKSVSNKSMSGSNISTDGETRLIHLLYSKNMRITPEERILR